ncbi:AAA family ATPase [Rubrimonas cliftonensis]|uniref:Transitional endoplasmic reticulum ATPase n=1 Tax=Rubrimonas cliftonensis TaxID=89524 RepID=A0A1H4AMH2_9RHOB|nr:AAA family ATPase [Rubrimonas cliftonensis]SEA36967.1 transitional endoplasmic reticulum ATPase [Rubrimonas cliftonensis]
MTHEGPAPEAASRTAAARLVVDAAAPTDADRGVARIEPAAMAALGLRPGDLLRIKGSGTAYARALPLRAPIGAPIAAQVGDRSARASDAAAARIRLDEAQRASAGLALGDAAEVSAAPAPPPAAALTLRLDGAAPRDAAEIAAALEDHPLSEGAVVAGRLPGGRRFTAVVAALDPAPLARMTAAARLTLSAPEAASRYGGVAGLEAQVARVREMVELPLKRPDLFARLGVTPPRGVLFTGPPGSGKTLLARAVAEESGAAFFQIDGPEIVSKHYGDSEAKLREVFAAAEKRAPAVIFIDEIDAIAPKRGDLSGEKQLERRLVAQLLTLMDGLSARGQVVVMAATNMPHALDGALRRPGRFDREIAFAAPDRAARRAILALHLERAPLAPDVDLEALAEATPGFVGADLAALAREAAMAAVARAALEAGGMEQVDAATLSVTGADMEAARAVVGPSALRAAQVEIPDARWSDIGGLDAAKQALTEAVIWPMRHGAAHRALGLAPVSGVLLAGPPGGGKTLLARALAAESQANFIAVRGAHLVSRWLGDSEKAVAELFAQARHAAPCVLFFDEIDAVAPARGAADAAMTRVVAQLLVEIDGICQSRGVFLLGATNRPDAIDPALLRPGRFDEIIRLDAPDATARRDILAVHTRETPLAEDVDLEALANAADGWSGAELRALAQGAARAALRRALRAGDGAAPQVRMLDFAAARAARARSNAALRGDGGRGDGA